MSESKEQLEFAAPNWARLASIVYQPAKDASGDSADRFEFAVTSRNGLLKPGEAQQIAAMIVREHNSHAALVGALCEARLLIAALRDGLSPKASWEEYEAASPQMQRINSALGLAEKES